MKPFVYLWIVLLMALTGCPASPAPTDGGNDARGDGAGTDGCPTDQMFCDGVCVATATSTTHCGRCRNACATGEACTSGVCLPSSCASGQTRCSDVCVDTSSDGANCGTCGHACGAGMACGGGTCGSACASPRTSCTSGGTSVCTDLLTDPSNCGTCGTACAAGQSCNGGLCGCATGQTACSGACVDTMTSTEHCGTCGHACAAGQACTGGTCGCASPLTACGASCVNTMTDPAHCGSCAAPACNAPNSCNAGVCNAVCGVGTTACAGTCINPQVDIMNCGACGNVCGPTRACLLGVCRPSNDLRASPTPIVFTPGETIIHGHTGGATHDGPTVPCACTSGGDVWFRFTLTAEEIVYFDTAGTMFDTSLSITNATGTPVPAQDTNGVPRLGLCNDDALCPTMTGGFTARTQSRTWGRFVAGTYLLVVGGCGSGEFDLHVQHFRVDAGGEFEGYIAEGLGSFPGTLPATSVTAGTCGGPTGTANGEDVKYFVTCGGAAQFFSLCMSDGGSFERHQFQTDFDPAMYLRSANTALEVACNDDGSTMGGTACAGTGGDTLGFGSRLNNIVAPRGINALFIDSRSGGDATLARMDYTVQYFVRNTP